MSKLEQQEILPTLKDLLEKLEKGEKEVHAYQLDALRQTIEQYETHERPMSSYFNLEDWLYKQEKKSIEIKSAILWGGLWVVKEMGCIDWDSMRKLYGEFMSKNMNLR